MQSNSTTMIENLTTKATALSCMLVVNRLWQVKRRFNWPSFAEY